MKQLSKKTPVPSCVFVFGIYLPHISTSDLPNERLAWATTGYNLGGCVVPWLAYTSSYTSMQQPKKRVRVTCKMENLT